MGRVSAWEALLLGVVEGLTEFLPVSSTGHLTLLFHLLGLPVEEDPFLKTFLVAIQLGAILAVLLLYGRRLAADRALWLRIAVAFVPTGVIGFLFYPLIKGVILGNDAVVAFFLFFVGAVLLFADRLAERAQYQDVKALPLARVAWIGVFQGLAALFPGTSRSGATILGASSWASTGKPPPSSASSWPFPPCSPPWATTSGKAPRRCPKAAGPSSSSASSPPWSPPWSPCAGCWPSWPATASAPSPSTAWPWRRSTPSSSYARAKARSKAFKKAWYASRRAPSPMRPRRRTWPRVGPIPPATATPSA